MLGLTAIYRGGRRGQVKGGICSSAPSPFTMGHLARLRRDPEALVAELYPDFRAIYAMRGLRMFFDISRFM
jgi:hypothetical protein